MFHLLIVLYLRNDSLHHLKMNVFDKVNEIISAIGHTWNQTNATTLYKNVDINLNIIFGRTKKELNPNI